MVWPQSSAEKPIARLSHELSAACLSSESVTAFHVLVHLLAKVLFDNGDFSVWLLGVRIGLDGLQMLRQGFQRVVLGVGDEEREIDQVVRIRKVLQMGEEHGQVLLGISKRDAEEDSLLALPAARGALDVGEVVVSDRFELQVIVSRQDAERDEGGDRSGLAEPEDEDEDDNNCYADANRCPLAFPVGRERGSWLEPAGIDWLAGKRRNWRWMAMLKPQRATNNRTCGEKSRRCRRADIHSKSRWSDAVAS
jgi:hypothetical protein